MRRGLSLFGAAVILAMLALTLTASLDRSVLAALVDLWPDPWFRATLADAYFAFLTFYAWVWYKEPAAASRLGWFVGILCLGSIAMAAYLLRELARTGAGRGIEGLLLRRGAP